MAVILEVIDGPEKGRSFSFDEADAFLVGRSPRAHLRLDPTADPFVSRAHCLLELRPPRSTVTDLGSTNGTTLNDLKIRSAELVDGDVIRVGHTAIRIHIAGPSPAAEAALRCALCGAVLNDASAASAADGEATRRHVCDDCSQRARVAQLESVPRSTGKVTCHGCGADVSEAASSDQLGHLHQEVLYLCPACVHRESREHGADRRIGNYRILAEIGRGGMGVVYRATHKGSGRLCAVKQLLPDTARDEIARRRFEREIDVQATVNHPHLVRVWDRARDEDELLYFVTEYLDGGDMERLASKVYRGPVDPEVAVRLICQVLEGLQELHQRGMIHRDLKPANFLLSRHGTARSCVAKISDYGLAKCYEEAGHSIFAYTNAGHVAGSMLFMAPEQITNFRYVRPPSDVYSVGVSLYYLLSATYTVDFIAPPVGAPQGRVRHPVEMIVEDPPVPLLERRSVVPASLAAVVDRAVQKNPNDRFQTAEELRLALERVAGELEWS